MNLFELALLAGPRKLGLDGTCIVFCFLFFLLEEGAWTSVGSLFATFAVALVE